MPKAPEHFSTCQKTTKSLPRISPKSYRHNAVPNRFSSRFSPSLTNGLRSLSRVKAGTHSPSPTGSHTAAYTAKQGRFGWGGITTLGAFHTFQKPCAAGYQNGKFCRFWVLVGDAPEERRKPSEQRCAYARRCSEGVAAPLGCVIFLQFGDVAVFSLCAQYFLNVRGGGGITTLGAFHTVRKPCVAVA